HEEVGETPQMELCHRTRRSGTVVRSPEAVGPSSPVGGVSVSAGTKDARRQELNLKLSVIVSVRESAGPVMPRGGGVEQAVRRARHRDRERTGATELDPRHRSRRGPNTAGALQSRIRAVVGAQEIAAGS